VICITPVAAPLPYDKIQEKNWAFKEGGSMLMRVSDRHWLDYDLVAFAALLIGLTAIELLALSI
jgi:hypothetical protein